MLLEPRDVGLAPGIGARRVPGLRREEVAILAGISSDYYRRLEQGRDVNPSPQVVAALARALRLDDVGAAHLRSLALPGYVVGSAGLSDGDEAVPERVRWLIDSWPHTAAVVHNRYIDVLASNALARAITPLFRVGFNDLESLFVEPSLRELHRDWDGLVGRSVALLRNVADKHLDDERLTALVTRISERSELFRTLWERNDVAITGGGTHVLNHLVVGELELQFTQLPLIGTGGLTIFCYFAEPGTPSAASLERLATLGGDQQGQEPVDRSV